MSGGPADFQFVPSAKPAPVFLGLACRRPRWSVNYIRTTTTTKTTTNAIRRVLLIIKHFPGAFDGRDLFAENVTAGNLDFSDVGVHLPFLPTPYVYVAAAASL